jgi:outer membrane murein-binding lipoprotein Lpp
MKRIVLALVASGALALAGCQTLDGKIAEASDRLSARCADLQTAALAVDLFAPEKVRAAAQQGQVVLSQFCAKPPRTAADLAIAIGETMKALQAIEAAKRG